jgi:leader peptidase (prepilin peptidase) / N-methyltransferase
VTYLFVGAVGFLLGLSAHDLALQSLREETPLRPLKGVCRQCGHERGWTRWRCPSCGTNVARELAVAIISTLVAIGFLHTLSPGWVLGAYLAFAGLSMALVVTDIEAFRIVDRLNLPGTVVVALLLTGAAVVSGEADSLLRALGGAAAYFAGASMLFIMVRGNGFGAGDVKLAPQLGLFTAYLGWGVLGWAVFATAVIGGVLAVVALVAGGADRKTELPYGPPMILGAWAAVVLVGVGAIPIPS